jgi:hypothetical protein
MMKPRTSVVLLVTLAIMGAGCASNAASTDAGKSTSDAAHKSSSDASSTSTDVHDAAADDEDSGGSCIGLLQACSQEGGVPCCAHLFCGIDKCISIPK